jgi:hypothetical protein
MRPLVGEARLRELARRLGRLASGPTRIYLTDGATAVLEGWRGSTIGVDLRFEPDIDEMLNSIAFIAQTGSAASTVSAPA